MSIGAGSTHAYLLPSHIGREALRGGVAVVIVQFRASTTICAALCAGARAVHSCPTPEEARAMKTRDATVLLGGERHGVLIEGFDLANSPSEYTRERVLGRDVAFTTTNGTRAVHHAREQGAPCVLIGCLANVSAVADRLVTDPRPVHLVCAGTRGMATMEDCVAAGAIAQRLAGAGRPFAEDDTARMLAAAFVALAHDADDLAPLLRDSFGGRNLRRQGLEADIAHCSVLDRYSVVPELNAGGAFVLARSF